MSFCGINIVRSFKVLIPRLVSKGRLSHLIQIEENSFADSFGFLRAVSSFEVLSRLLRGFFGGSRLLRGFFGVSSGLLRGHTRNFLYFGSRFLRGYFGVPSGFLQGFGVPSGFLRGFFAVPSHLDWYKTKPFLHLWLSYLWNRRVVVYLFRNSYRFLPCRESSLFIMKSYVGTRK